MVQLSRVWRGAALFFTTLAGIFGVVSLRMRWGHTHADFDVLGVMWVMENVGQVGVLLLFLTSGLGALYFWVRYLLSDR
jgi:hypothetical protein